MKNVIKLSDVKEALSDYENSYKNAAKQKNYASWSDFWKGLLNAANDNNGNMEDIIFQAEDAFHKLDIKKS